MFDARWAFSGQTRRPVLAHADLVEDEGGNKPFHFSVYLSGFVV
jgi:hypothetical protein